MLAMSWGGLQVSMQSMVRWVAAISLPVMSPLASEEGAGSMLMKLRRQVRDQAMDTLRAACCHGAAGLAAHTALDNCSLSDYDPVGVKRPGLYLLDTQDTMLVAELLLRTERFGRHRMPC